MKKALKNNPIPIGIFYQSEYDTFEDNIRGDDKSALFTHHHDMKTVQKLFEKY